MRFIFALSLLFLSFSQVHAASLIFETSFGKIYGEYQLPTSPLKGAIVFVHGDADTPLDSHGYYPILWRVLLKNGYAVFSWDKPGVGRSEGNWLHQSMEDRQNELVAGVEKLKSHLSLGTEQIGVIGFSQAGWVVPAAAAKASPPFGYFIGVGFAINWVEQSWYYTKTKLLINGTPPSQLPDHELRFRRKIQTLSESQSYTDYLQKTNTSSKELSEDRYLFIRKNFTEDARQAYRQVKMPFLILMGDKDLNVDPDDTLGTLAPLAEAKPHIVKLLKIKNANHGLLRADFFPEQDPGYFYLFKMFFLGEYGLAPDFMPQLLDWLSSRGPVEKANTEKKQPAL